MPTSTPYAPQIKIPELLEREKGNTTTLPIYRDGVLAVPTEVRYTLYKPDQTKLIDNAAASFPANIPTYVHSSSSLDASLALGEGYLQEWKITIVGDVYVFRRMRLDRLESSIYD